MNKWSAWYSIAEYISVTANEDSYKAKIWYCWFAGLSLRMGLWWFVSGENKIYHIHGSHNSGMPRHTLSRLVSGYLRTYLGWHANRAQLIRVPLSYPSGQLLQWPPTRACHLYLHLFHNSWLSSQEYIFHHGQGQLKVFNDMIIIVPFHLLPYPTHSPIHTDPHSLR